MFVFLRASRSMLTVSMTSQWRWTVNFLYILDFISRLVVSSGASQVRHLPPDFPAASPEGEFDELPYLWACLRQSTSLQKNAYYLIMCNKSNLHVIW